MLGVFTKTIYTVSNDDKRKENVMFFRHQWWVDCKEELQLHADNMSYRIIEGIHIIEAGLETMGMVTTVETIERA